MTAMLQVEGLTKHFEMRRGVLRRVAGIVQAVNDVSFAVADGETLAVAGIGPRRSGDQRPGVGVTRMGEEIRGRRFLDDAAQIDHGDAVGHVPHHGQIVTDEDIPDAELGPADPSAG